MFLRLRLPRHSAYDDTFFFGPESVGVTRFDCINILMLSFAFIVLLIFNSLISPFQPSILIVHFMIKKQKQITLKQIPK